MPGGSALSISGAAFLPRRFAYFLIDTTPDFHRHRLFPLFHDMADQPDRAPEYAKTTHAARREAQLAGKRADCASRIYRHHAARRSFCARMNALHQIDVAAVESGLCSDRKKAQHARIDRLVDWMANAGNDALFGTIAVDDLCGELDEVRARVISAIGKCLLEHDRGMFHATDEHAAQAAQTGRNCGLQRLRCAGDGHARGDRTRRYPMLDKGYGDRIEELRLRRCRLAPRELEESHVAQVEMADDFVRQIEATHGDSIGCTPTQVAADRLMFTAHGSSFHIIARHRMRRDPPRAVSVSNPCAFRTSRCDGSACAAAHRRTAHSAAP